MNDSPLLVEQRGAVRLITLNRPERMNALGGGMVEALLATFADAARDDGTGSLVMTGAGRGFCAGADLGNGGPAGRIARADGGRSRRERIDPLGAAGRTILALRGMEKPVIAAVNGVAAGAGFGLATACDLRLASTEARFSTIFIKRGLAPDFGSSYFLPRIVGISVATEIFLTGRMLGADEAAKIGLVSRVLPPERLLKEAMRLAEEVAAGPPLALQYTQRALSRSLDNSLEEQLALEWAGQTVCLASEDAREGIAAWTEKRAPVWKGR
jgi:2-(1,2-epoxy-1,2-dihydrophenyl)acetyl-CoA isomerase